MLETSDWRNPRLSGRIRELDEIRGLSAPLIVVFHYHALMATLTCAAISWRWMELPLIRRASARYSYREGE